jgi:hypothetical protein
MEAEDGAQKRDRWTGALFKASSYNCLPFRWIFGARFFRTGGSLRLPWMAEHVSSEAEQEQMKQPIERSRPMGIEAWVKGRA